MCVRKVGYRVAEKRFVAIPRLPPPSDKDAMSKFVVDTLCSWCSLWLSARAAAAILAAFIKAVTWFWCLIHRRNFTVTFWMSIKGETLRECHFSHC